MVPAISSSFLAPSGVRISYETWGEGPTLVVIHGAFSDQRTNWMYVAPYLKPHFTVHAIARRGRSPSDATEGHSIEDEMQDAAALIRQVRAPVLLLGHSYGALVALGAAALVPHLVRKLGLYEAPWPTLLDAIVMVPLEALAAAGNWDGFAQAFFTDILFVPHEVIDALRVSVDWAAIVGDAPATLGDLRALASYEFVPERYSVTVPTLLQVGSESPAERYVTRALAAVLPDVTIGVLEGQAHEGMTTAPEQYVDALSRSPAV